MTQGFTNWHDITQYVLVFGPNHTLDPIYQNIWRSTGRWQNNFTNILWSWKPAATITGHLASIISIVVPIPFMTKLRIHLTHTKKVMICALSHALGIVPPKSICEDSTLLWEDHSLHNIVLKHPVALRIPILGFSLHLCATPSIYWIHTLRPSVSSYFYFTYVWAWMVNIMYIIKV